MNDEASQRPLCVSQPPLMRLSSCRHAHASGQKIYMKFLKSVSASVIQWHRGKTNPPHSSSGATMRNPSNSDIQDRLLLNCSIIANAIIDRLEADGTLVWTKTFKGGDNDKPTNVTTGYAYGGVFNPMFLSIVADTQFDGDNRFAGFSQFRKSGNPVRKGSTGFDIFFPKFRCKACGVPLYGRGAKCSNGHSVKRNEDKRWSGWGVSRVFNMQQTTNPVPMVKGESVDPEVGFATAAEFFGNIEVNLSHAGGRAFYSPKEDRVQIPAPENFETIADYWAVRAHETAHWTGHESRLNRKGIVNFTCFGSEEYAYEELVAEMGSAFLCNHLGVAREGLVDNHAAYIASWKKRLTEDPLVVRKAASDAGAILKYLVDKGEGKKKV